MSPSAIPRIDVPLQLFLPRRPPSVSGRFEGRYNSFLDIKLEEPDRIGASDQEPCVLVNHSSGIEPLDGILHGFVWIVGAEIHSIPTHHFEGAAKSRVVEVAARGDVEMFAEILAQGPLAAIAPRREAHARFQPPQPKWDQLTQMAEYNLKVGILVENARTAQTQSVNGRIDAKAPRRAHQPGMPLVDRRP